jgi:hypothetical protein
MIDQININMYYTKSKKLKNYHYPHVNPHVEVHPILKQRVEIEEKNP